MEVPDRLIRRDGSWPTALIYQTPFLQPRICNSSELNMVKTNASQITFRLCFACALWMVGSQLPAQSDPFRKENLVAWCIVPFDSQHRTPQQRAEMLNQLGITQLAYDYRAEHIPTFDDEIEQLKKHRIKLFAWWFPTQLNDEAKLILKTLEKHQVQTQLWVTGGGAMTKSDQEQQQRVESESQRIRPIAEAAAKIGCSVGLYNHGGWFGEPENQLAIIEHLKLPNVGIVYNQHHGHEHVDRFAELLAKMKPHLLALNLNGMIPGGDQIGQKIVPLGGGPLDVGLLKIIRESGYNGPIGILNHTDHDAEQRLKDNLEGLEWLLPQLTGQPAKDKPKFRTWTAPSKQTSAIAKPSASALVEGQPSLRTPPLTIVCNAQLNQAQQYNILVASDTKASGLHWELFSQAGSGQLATYLPGYKPDLIVGSIAVCDDRPHQLVMLYEPHRVRLYVDQQLAADQAIERTQLPAVPGGFAVGRLVEGGLQCFGQLGSVRVYQGIADVATLGKPQFAKDLQPVGDWHFTSLRITEQLPQSRDVTTVSLANYAPETVQSIASETIARGQAGRGVSVFASAKSACLSCHKIGKLGGSVGPELTNIGTQRTIEQLIESVLWPNRHVEDKYRVTQLLTADGELLRGYVVEEGPQSLQLKDPSSGALRRLALEDIESRSFAPSLMPEGLANVWNREQIADVIAYLADLGHHQKLRAEIAESVLEHAQAHAPKDFAFDRRPLDETAWPTWQTHVNRDRIYDFYAKQAEHFRTQDLDHNLLMEFPGLDGGQQGHWGNQVEATWASDEWNHAQLGSVQSGVFTAPGLTVARGVCVQLGDDASLFTCFDPDSLSYVALWKEAFLKFSDVRHGFVGGVTPAGPLLEMPKLTKPDGATKYHGFYRVGKRVVFAYRIGDTEYLDSPWVKDGRFIREMAPRSEHSLRDQLAGPTQWPESMTTEIRLGDQRPYALDTIELPIDNPWHAPIYCGGHDFLPDGSALVATIQGDVWHVSGLNDTSTKPRAVWRRFASGLHHALGVKADQDGIFVMCRDQLTRLKDLNQDGEADFYECFSNAFETSPAGHDFICGLERDAEGRFYTASGNQGLVRISRDGRQAESVAEGFRNPDGLGIYPDGVVTVPCSEGEWTPASMICAITPQHMQSIDSKSAPAFFGYRGQKFTKRPISRPELPMVYLPRGVDNSAGGQVFINSERWGPLSGQMVHLSFGTGAHFLLLRDEVDGQLQGAVMPLAGDFLSGVHRGRFSPIDGQLYVTGMAGWGSYNQTLGCFQRVRWNATTTQLPVGFHLHRNGVAIQWSQPVDAAQAKNPQQHFAQAWNYRYSAAYGSAEYSALHYGLRGHDRLKIASSQILDGGRTLFLEIPSLLPCNQLHLRIAVQPQRFVDLFVTCNRLDQPRTDFPNALPVENDQQTHPLDQDMAIAVKRVPNPWRGTIPNARKIEIAAGKNLTFDTRRLHARSGEAIALTFNNPDAVPHNWVLIRPDKLQEIGAEANKLVADPEALIRHYVPQHDGVICFTDIVESQDSTTIHFRAPEKPGRYPYLCTFPGHWMVMNGELIVD